MRVRIYFLSRDPRLLFVLTVLILGVGTLLGFHLGGTARERSPNALEYIAIQPEKGGPLLQETIALTTQPGGEPVEKLARILRALAMDDASAHSQLVATSIVSPPLTPERRALYSAYWNSLTSLTREPNAYLLLLAYQQAQPGANYLAAELYGHLDQNDRAIHFLQREAIFPQSAMARQYEIEMRLSKKDLKGLAPLADDPRYEKEWTPLADFFVAAEGGNYVRAAIALARHETTGLDPAVIGLVCLSGLLWFTLCMQAMQALEAPLFRIGLGLCALALGMASVIPTLLLDVWMDKHTTLQLGNGLLGDLYYCVASIGFREELCKLLAFLPFVPFLLRRGNRLEMLIIAACAGLGFAVAENLQYFSQNLSATFGRFLTANCFHLAGTGLIGLYLCETLLSPREKWSWFPICFVWVVVLHGLYDLFLINQLLSPLSLLSILCFLWIALTFFRQMRRYRSEESNYFWMPATILLGLSTLLAATFVEASRLWSPEMAATILTSQAISLVMMVYLLIWQTGNLRQDQPGGESL